MANRIVQTIYDLKDKVSGKLVQISRAYKRHGEQAEDTSDKIVRDNQRVSESYGRIGKAVGSLRGLAAGAAAFLGLSKLKDGIVAVLKTGDQFEQFRVRFENLFGSVEAGASAFERVKEIASTTPQTLEQVAETAARLKSFGLDPLNGSMEALIDQNASLGGSYETLSGLTLAMGQAWAKQKLQGEEILQLVERGVPVWDLLAKATGKNTLELQQLSSAGKLGRDAIAALIREMGAANMGQASKQMGLLSGITSNLRDQWEKFLNLIAQSGTLDYFKGRLQALLQTVQQMSADGRLQAWAKRISDAIVSAAQAIGSAASVIGKFGTEIATAAAAVAAFRIGKFVEALRGVNTAAAAAGKNTTLLGGAVGKLSGALGKIKPVAFTALGAAIAWSGTQVLKAVSAVSSLLDQQSRLEAQQQRLRDGEVDLALKVRDRLAAYKQYADVAVASADELAAKSELQAEHYLHELQGALKYYAALRLEAKKTGDAAGMAGATTKVRELQDAIKAAEVQVQDAAKAAAAAESKFSEFALSATRAFDAAINGGKSAAQAVAGIFAGVDLTSVQQLRDVAETVHLIGVRGTAAGQAIEDELRRRILQLSGQDFVALRAAATEAFAEGTEGAKTLAGVLDNINLSRLGVDLEQIKTGFSTAGRAAIDTFAAAIDEIRDAGLTAKQQSDAIAVAFENAMKRAKTAADKAALKQAFQDAGGGAKDYASDLDTAADASQSFAREAEKTTVSNAELAESARAAGRDVRKMGDEFVDATGSTSAAANAMADAVGGWRAEFAKTSDAAAELFDEVMKGAISSADAMRVFGSADTGGGLLAGLAKITLAQREVNEQIDRQRSRMDALIDTYDAMGVAADGAFAGTSANLDGTLAGIDRMIHAVESGNTQFRLLGQQDLGRLMQSLEAARQRVRALQEQARQAREQLDSMGESIQDQIDSIQGNETAIEQRRYQEQLEQLRDLAETSRTLNSREYQQAVARAKQLHNLKMQQLQQQAAEKSRQDARDTARDTRNTQSRSSGAGGGMSTIDVNVNGKNLGAVNPNDSASIEAMARQMLPAIMRQLKQAAAASGRSNVVRIGGG